MTDELPKQELLKKLLKMTTSANDGEALIAIRKANDLLRTAAWDWDKLIDGKIRVVEDPFAAMARPKKAEMAAPPPPSPPPPHTSSQPIRPARARQQTQTYYCIDGCGRVVQGPAFACLQCTAAKQQRAAQSSFPKIDSTRSNAYGGWCYCCGINVSSRDGFIFDPHTHNHRAASKWQIVCTSCNQSRSPNIGPSPTPRRTAKPDWVDLNNL